MNNSPADTLAVLRRNVEMDPSRPKWMRELMRKSVDAFAMYPAEADAFLKTRDVSEIKEFMDGNSESCSAATIEYMQVNRDRLNHFRLTPDVVRALPRTEVHATLAGLKEIDALHLPFPAVWITFNLDDFADSVDWYNQNPPETGISQLEVSFVAIDSPNMRMVEDTGELTFRAVTSNWFYTRHSGGSKAELDAQQGAIFHDRKLTEHNRSLIQTVGQFSINAIGCLITALATRNIKKDVNINARAAKGKPSKPTFRAENGTIYASMTKLELPQNLPLDESSPPTEGTRPKAHLRRGHVHTFLYGPGKTERRKQWVQPIFVNADATFVQQARQYKVAA